MPFSPVRWNPSSSEGQRMYPVAVPSVATISLTHWSALLCAVHSFVDGRAVQAFHGFSASHVAPGPAEPTVIKRNTRAPTVGRVKAVWCARRRRGLFGSTNSMHCTPPRNRGVSAGADLPGTCRTESGLLAVRLSSSVEGAAGLEPAPIRANALGALLVELHPRGPARLPPQRTYRVVVIYVGTSSGIARLLSRSSLRCTEARHSGSSQGMTW